MVGAGAVREGGDVLEGRWVLSGVCVGRRVCHLCQQGRVQSVVACKCDVCSDSVQVGICQHHSVLCEHHSVLCEWAQCTYVALYGAQYIHTYIHC